jgi:hypothetical protein
MLTQAAERRTGHFSESMTAWRLNVIQSTGTRIGNSQRVPWQKERMLLANWFDLLRECGIAQNAKKPGQAGLLVVHDHGAVKLFAKYSLTFANLQQQRYYTSSTFSALML